MKAEDHLGKWVNLTSSFDVPSEAVLAELDVDISDVNDFGGYQLVITSDTDALDLLWTADKWLILPRSSWRPKVSFPP